HLPVTYLLLSSTHSSTTHIYTLSLHDALPIYTGLLKAHGCQISMSRKASPWENAGCESWMKTLKYEEVYRQEYRIFPRARLTAQDRKSTRLNSSHLVISYAVFCLKKKKKITNKTVWRKLSLRDDMISDVHTHLVVH